MDIKEKIKTIEGLINSIKDKTNNIYFYVTDANNVYSSELEYIYLQAKLLKDNGYNVSFFTNDEKFAVPSYLDESLKNLKHYSPSKVSKLNISASDFIIIPEFFTNIIKSFEHINCGKIIIAQNYDYIIKGLVSGMNWLNLGISDVIVSNDNIRKFLNEYHENENNKYDIKNFTIGVPSYFKGDYRFKLPKIGIYGRNPNEIEKFVKLFYQKNPKLAFVKFVELRGETGLQTRKEFSKTMKDCSFVVWLDRIAGFGTVPIEAMLNQSIVCGLIPDLAPEYMVDKSGVWCSDIFNLVNEVSGVFYTWLMNNINDENHFNHTDEIASNYTMENFNQTTLSTYEYFLTKRLNMLTDMLNHEINSNQTI
jgi:hypothetical protein